MLVRWYLILLLVAGLGSACSGTANLQHPADSLTEPTETSGDASDVDVGTITDTSIDTGVDSAADAVIEADEGSPTSVCGNLVVEGDEACDDGLENNDDKADACRMDCTLPTCGDGVADTGEDCDDGNLVDSDACTSACTSGPGFAKPAPGQVIFTELMINPFKVADPTGEWIEIRNLTATPFDLSGCTLHDAGSDVVQLEGENLHLAAGATLVFGFETAPQLNGGAGVDYGYKTLLLDNSYDEVKLSCGDTLIDQVSYTPLFTGIMEGHALALGAQHQTAELNDNPFAWCTSQVLFGAGDYGTPGTPNPDCPIVDTSVDHCVLTSDVEVLGFFGSPTSLTLNVVEVGITTQSQGVDANPALMVQVGFGPPGVSPTHEAWNWFEAAGQPEWHSIMGADGYVGSVIPEAKGIYEAAGRASLDGGLTWSYCDRITGSSDGYQSPNATVLNVATNPCAEDPCSGPPPAVCSDDGLTLLTYGNDAFCTALSQEEVHCLHPTIEVSCMAQGLLCQEGACKAKIEAPKSMGDLIFTEALMTPASGKKTARWFELFNPNAPPLNLQGCWISDGQGGSHYIKDPFVITSQTYAVVAGSLDLELNDGLDADYAFGDDIELEVGGFGVSIACNSVIIDSIVADDEFPPPSGTAFALSPYKTDAYLNDLMASWCPAIAPYGVGNLGSPGEENPACPNDTVSIANCTLNALPNATIGAGQSFPVELEAVIFVKPDSVTVTPLFKFGFGPAGTTADSDEWTWVAAEKLSDLEDMDGLDPNSGVYGAVLELSGEGSWNIAGYGSADDGKSSELCDLNGSKQGFSLADCPTLWAEPSPCWPDPCGGPALNVCYQDQVVNTQGKAMCDINGDEAVCLWDADVLKDCTLLGGTCEQGECQGIPNQPSTGDLIFSELLIVPGENQAEWFELTNLQGVDLLLSDCVLESDVNEYFDFPIAPTEDLIVPANGAIALVREGGDPPSQLEAAPTFSGVSLSNKNDTLTLRCGGAIVDTIAWDPTWPIKPFQSMQLSSDALSTQENDSVDAWCSSEESTPGTLNPICP
jgi:cysteine-rich repeat protein